MCHGYIQLLLQTNQGERLFQPNLGVNLRQLLFEQMTEEHIGYMLSKIPRNRFVELEEVSSLVSWLSSEENSYSTGAVFDISGGRATY